ncbi:hypothetical protein D3C76_1360800 [compost metagenome]
MIGTSSSDTAEVKAAIASRMKNNPPKNAPNGIAENAAGSAMKTKDGPASASNPKEAVVGKIISPAINA